MRRIVFAVAVVLSLIAPMSANAEDASFDVSVEVWRVRIGGDSGNDGPCVVAMFPSQPTGQVSSVSIGDPTGLSSARQPGVVVRDETGAIAAFWQVADAKLVYSGSMGVRCIASHTFTLPTSHPYYTIWLDDQMIHMFAADAAPADTVSIQVMTGEPNPV